MGVFKVSLKCSGVAIRNKVAGAEIWCMRGEGVQCGGLCLLSLSPICGSRTCVKLDSDYSGSAPWSKFFALFPPCEVSSTFRRNCLSFICDVLCIYSNVRRRAGQGFVTQWYEPGPDDGIYFSIIILLPLSMRPDSPLATSSPYAPSWMGLCHNSAQLDGASTTGSPVGWTFPAPPTRRRGVCDRLHHPVRFGALCVFCCLQSVGEHLVEPGDVLQPDANANERLGHGVLRRPIELCVVREDGVRAREGEVGAEAGALVARERVIERLRRALAREREREEAPEAAAGQTARGVVGRGLPLWVEDLGDGRGRDLGGRVQQVADVLGTGVDLRRALGEVARVSFHEDGVLVVVGVFVPREQSFS